MSLVQKVPLDTGSGTVAVTDVVRLTVSKDKFLTVDWNALANKPIYSPIKEILDDPKDLYIEPRVARSIPNANVLILVRS